MDQPVERPITPEKQKFRLAFLAWANLLSWIALVLAIAGAFAPVEAWKTLILPNIKVLGFVYAVYAFVVMIMYGLLYFTRSILEGEKQGAYLAGLILFGITTITSLFLTSLPQ